jgi:hypothetical protein
MLTLEFYLLYNPDCITKFAQKKPINLKSKLFYSQLDKTWLTVKV